MMFGERRDRDVEVFTRFDVAYDQALTASVLWCAGDEAQQRGLLPLFQQIHRTVGELQAIRDKFEALL